MGASVPFEGALVLALGSVVGRAVDAMGSFEAALGAALGSVVGIQTESHS